MATGTNSDFRISFPNPIHLHKRARMRSARNPLPAAWLPRAKINNSSIKNYAVVAVFSRVKARISALNFVLGWSQPLLRKVISWVKYLLKTKTSLHSKNISSLHVRQRMSKRKEYLFLSGSSLWIGNGDVFCLRKEETNSLVNSENWQSKALFGCWCSTIFYALNRNRGRMMTLEGSVKEYLSHIQTENPPHHKYLWVPSSSRERWLKIYCLIDTQTIITF